MYKLNNLCHDQIMSLTEEEFKFIFEIMFKSEISHFGKVYKYKPCDEKLKNKTAQYVNSDKMINFICSFRNDFNLKVFTEDTGGEWWEVVLGSDEFGDIERIDALWNATRNVLAMATDTFTD